jgi:hypothetical protein
LIFNYLIQVASYEWRSFAAQKSIGVCCFFFENIGKANNFQRKNNARLKKSLAPL